eukprot:TRINITY_DN23820_c0_g1_i2.p1 TRINITY_DN23820_c0_g1~~TRINITY_DN23820_c0_g1_i2.p1  ORF type:complete len:508 (+),score=124.51 TRINITY_DN23820_c0_g1_i2:95-1525(+)
MRLQQLRPGSCFFLIAAASAARVNLAGSFKVSLDKKGNASFNWSAADRFVEVAFDISNSSEHNDSRGTGGVHLLQKRPQVQRTFAAEAEDAEESEGVEQPKASLVGRQHSLLEVHADSSSRKQRHLRQTLLDLADRAEDALGEKNSRRLEAIIFSSGTITAILLGLACLGAACWGTSYWQPPGTGIGRKGPRHYVEALPRCSGKDEVEKHLPASSGQGYDCAFSTPLSSGIPVRLEGIVEGTKEAGAALVAPLSGQNCVLYSAAVARQIHDGMHPVPVAFATASHDFVLAVRSDPGLRVELKGEDVFLFDMHSGRQARHCSFADAPDHWQDFVLTHRAAAMGGEFQPSSALRAEGEALGFQECALLVGAKVTAVGELFRGSDGKLSLRPCTAKQGVLKDDAKSEGATDQNLTSWERASGEGAFSSLATAAVSRAAAVASMKHEEPDLIAEAGLHKVMVSDDPMLPLSCLQAWHFRI